MNKKSTPWIVIGLSCGVVAAGFVAFMAFIFFVVIGSMRNSDPVRDGLRIARADRRVIAAAGAPIDTGVFISGSISTDNSAGKADLNIPVSGPKQGGSIHVVGTKTNGRWTYSELTFTPKSGSPIDLLTPLRTTTPGG